MQVSTKFISKGMIERLGEYYIARVLSYNFVNSFIWFIAQLIVDNMRWAR